MAKLIAKNPQKVKLKTSGYGGQPIGDFVPTSRLIAGIDLRDDITTAELKVALGIDNITVINSDRPPMGAPAEIDVNVLKVGDTWLQQGANIIYKLIEAQYNYSPAPDVEPRHYFTWRPLNERYGIGSTEPPTSVTYQAIIYTINEVQWSWLPVPEYFKGDHYQMQVGVDDPTYYICRSASLPSTGVCTYTWCEEGGSIDAYTKAETNALLADKMDLSQFVSDVSTVKFGQVFTTTDTIGVKEGSIGSFSARQSYTTAKTNNLLAKKADSDVVNLNDINIAIDSHKIYNVTDNGRYLGFAIFCGDKTLTGYAKQILFLNSGATIKYREARTVSGSVTSWGDWINIVDQNSLTSNYYTKTEINAMIPTVPTNISAFTNDSGYLTLGTLPIYDGTVI